GSAKSFQVSLGIGINCNLTNALCWSLFSHAVSRLFQSNPGLGTSLVTQAWCSSSMLDSELKTSGLRGPAGRSPARPPIFSAHPCVRWHRSVVALSIVSTLVSLVEGVGLPRRYQVL